MFPKKRIVYYTCQEEAATEMLNVTRKIDLQRGQDIEKAEEEEERF